MATRTRWVTARLRCKAHAQGATLAHPAAVPLRPLPVAIVMTAFHPGGTERQMIELIRRLDASRFRVHVACFHRVGTWLPRVETAAAEVVEFPLRSFKSPHTLLVGGSFVAWLRRRRIAVVQACDRYANIFGLPTAAVAGVPLRIGSRRELAPPDQTRAHRAALRLAYGTAHRIVANSTAAADLLHEEGVATDKIIVIPNGVDLSRFVESPPPARRRVVTVVANLRPGKGHDILLRAFASVASTMPDARLRLVGSGPLREPLERLAGVLGIAHAVEFLGHQEDIAEVLATSHVYAFPSWTEAFPNGLIEGMAAGLPTVATATGGMVELVEDGRNGLLVPPGDPSSLAAAIVRLMENPGLADALGRAARGTIEARYSFDRMVGEFSALYEQVAEDPHSRCVA
jgi:glycosyltransferase involved in cell wall biosynthesis